MRSTCVFSMSAFTVRAYFLPPPEGEGQLAQLESEGPAWSLSASCGPRWHTAGRVEQALPETPTDVSETSDLGFTQRPRSSGDGEQGAWAAVEGRGSFSLAPRSSC